MGMLTDITKRKKVEEALRSSNIYNRSLIEANPDPLITIGHDGKVTDMNSASEQITGYFRNELIGTVFSDYFTEPEKAECRISAGVCKWGSTRLFLWKFNIKMDT